MKYDTLKEHVLRVVGVDIDWSEVDILPFRFPKDSTEIGEVSVAGLQLKCWRIQLRGSEGSCDYLDYILVTQLLLTKSNIYL